MATLTIEISDEELQKLQDFCDRKGISVSKRINDLVFYADDDDDYEFVPNERTLAAFAEIEDMKRHPEKYKSYTDVDEMERDIIAEFADVPDEDLLV